MCLPRIVPKTEEKQNIQQPVFASGHHLTTSRPVRSLSTRERIPEYLKAVLISPQNISQDWGIVWIVYILRPMVVCNCTSVKYEYIPLF
jgi:hypothetical protein